MLYNSCSYVATLGVKGLSRTDVKRTVIVMVYFTASQHDLPSNTKTCRFPPLSQISIMPTCWKYSRP